MKTYHASSLEQIAIMFDDNAKQAKDAAERATNVKQANIQMVRANTWYTAAAILRDTELHEIIPAKVLDPML